MLAWRWAIRGVNEVNQVNQFSWLSPIRAHTHARTHMWALNMENGSLHSLRSLLGRENETLRTLVNMGKRKRDWAPLLEQADGRKRGPIGGRRDHRLPSWERLLEIDAAAEQEAARQQQAIAGPPRAAENAALTAAVPGRLEPERR